MHEAFAAFLGALAGSLVTLVLARRTALHQALGESYARARVELIEEIALLIAQLGYHMDHKEKIEASGKLRDLDEVGDEFEACLTKAYLYLPDDVIKKLRPFGQWAYSKKVHQHAEEPTREQFVEIWKVLANAIKKGN